MNHQSKGAVVICSFFFALTSVAYGYQEQIERNGDTLSGAWTSSNTPGSVGNSPLDRAPIAGNFYAFSGTFLSTTLTCDQFLAQVQGLISDWKLYPHINMYALSFCTVPPNGKSTTDFIYAIDAWTPEAVPVVPAFLKAHQGMQFQGEALEFYAVTGIDVKTVLSLSKLNGTALTQVHSAASSQSYSGTDQWWPDYTGRANVIQQTDGSIFLNYVAREFGSSEKSAFQQALGSSNFVNFGDFFTLHLQNGQTADFWLGFGSARQCGTAPCFSGVPSEY